MIRVKNNLKHPHPDLQNIDISGWSGNYNRHINKDNEVLICIDLDDKTIENMDIEYLTYCRIHNLNHTQIWLDKSKIVYISDTNNQKQQVEIDCFCKDCKHYEPTNNGIGYCYYWDYEQGVSPNKTHATDFCSNAKLKKQ